jgi:hypothetical protein
LRKNIFLFLYNLLLVMKDICCQHEKRRCQIIMSKESFGCLPVFECCCAAIERLSF